MSQKQTKSTENVEAAGDGRVKKESKWFVDAMIVVALSIQFLMFTVLFTLYQLDLRTSPSIPRHLV